MGYTFSKEWEGVLPGWLQQGVGRDLIDSVMLTIDALVEGIYQVRYGVIALDDDPPPDAVPFVARDRNLPPGFEELARNYFVRAALWRQYWQRAGRMRAMMEALAAVWGPETPKIRVVRNFGWAIDSIAKARWTTRNADGSYEEHIESPSNWDWDGQLLPGREWVIIYAPTTTPDMTDVETYGSPITKLWNDAGVRTDGVFDKKTWGTSAFREYVTRTRHVIDLFKPAYVKVDHIIIAFDPSSFDPTSPAGTPGMPDGTWGTWSHQVGGIQVATRLNTARYWKGT